MKRGNFQIELIRLANYAVKCLLSKGKETLVVV